MNVKIPEYTDINTVADLGVFTTSGYEYRITKQFLGNGFHSYSFEICLPIAIFFETQGNQPKTSVSKTIWWADFAQASSRNIILLKEDEGAIADFFEEEMDNAWDEDHLVLDYPYGDPHCSKWLTIFENAAKTDSIKWRKGSNWYCCVYGKTEIKIHENMEKDTEPTYKLYVRRDDGIGVCFNYQDDAKQSMLNMNRLHKLTQYIDGFVLRHLDNNKKTVEKEKTGKIEIGIKDFVVRQNIFKCMHSSHKIQNIEAVINIADFNGKKKQIKISAGYCPQCKNYFIMESTYQKLKKQGHILCRVSDEKTYMKSGYLINAKLAQESILMQYGYKVSQIDGLPEQQRRIILSVLIDNKVLSKTEIIGYLDFFINQRNSRSNMQTAISKWKADREFVENYRMGEYTQYGVNAIYRR